MDQAAYLSSRPAFLGTNENAVKTQIWIAISVYVLVAIVKKRLGVAASLYTILQILSLTLFEKTPLDQLLNDAALQNLRFSRFQPVEFLQLIAGLIISGIFGHLYRA